MTMHGHPLPGSTTTPCCAKEPRALPLKDRLTRDPNRITCNPPSPLRPRLRAV